MDILASLIQDFGIRRRKLDVRGLGDGIALRFPCDRSIGFHVVTRGRVFLHAQAAGGVVELAAGDIAFMARGCNHVLSRDASLASVKIEPIDASPPAPGRTPDGAAPEPDVAVISGAYQLWTEPVHPAFRELPDWLVLRGHALPRLGPVSLSAALLGQEAARREPGADLVVQSLLDMLFVYLLREVLAQQAPATGAWAEAMRDPPVRRAVELMHQDCARAWTLEDLAREVGLSRTLLAERFRTRMGDTPLNHLRTIRLQRAMRLLADTDHKLEAVAAEVGYGDAFSFSKAFRRAVGVAPGEFRQRDRADRQVPWRFAPGEALGVSGLRGASSQAVQPAAHLAGRHPVVRATAPRCAA